MRGEKYIEKFLAHRARMDFCLEQAEKTGDRTFLTLALEESKISDSWRDKLYRKWELKGKRTPTPSTSFEEEWSA